MIDEVENTMKDQFEEQLSALLDGELDPQEQERVVSRLTGGDNARLDRFGRYRLIGDVVRGESAVLANGVSDAVRSALEDEPTVLAPRRASWRWGKPAAGLALAASVAAAAIVVAPGFMQQPGGLETGPAIVEAPTLTQPIQLVASDNPVPVSRPVGNPPTGQWQTLDAGLSDRLNRLVIEHHEFGGRTGIKGPVAHIGLVNYAGR